MHTNIQPTEYNSYYQGYIERFSQKEIFPSLSKQREVYRTFVQNIPESKAGYRYAEGKWTPKEIMLHINDTERVMSYRALAISRNEQTPIPGFDQDIYVENCNADSRTIANIWDEFLAIRSATEHLFQHFSSDQLQMLGTASNSPVSVRALGYIILGHLQHHKVILEERYLDSI